MRHDLTVEGTAFRIRPIAEADAPAIINLRSDPLKNRFIHSISPKIEDQLAWLDRYFSRTGDYYFAVETRAGAHFEGTIALYDVADGKGEWGRWVLRPGSPAAPESALLIYRAAFERLGLDEVYCRTVALNESVLSFHDRCGLSRRGLLRNAVQLADGLVDVVEHYLTAQQWPGACNRLAPQAERIARLLSRGRGHESPTP